MPATSENTRTSNRLPLSPRVTSARRGGHALSRSEPVVQETVQENTQASPVARGVRVTPNAIIARRGAVGGGGSYVGAAGSLRAERRFAIR